MIRNRWAALAAMMCSLACQGFALAQQNRGNTDLGAESTATSGAIVSDAPAEARKVDGHIIVRMPDGQIRRIKLPLAQDEGRVELTARTDGEEEVQALPKFVIGVSLSEIPDSLRAHLSLPEGAGIMVGAVVPDSPAAKAGLMQYDLLLKSGDRELKVAKDLQEIVDTSEGKVVSVSLQRKGQPLTIDLTPVKREDLKLTQNAEINIPVAGTGAFLMDRGTDPSSWLELMQNYSGGPRTMVYPPVPMNGVPGAQVEALTGSIQKLTDQIERLQRAVDRLESRQSAEKPDVPAEAK